MSSMDKCICRERERESDDLGLIRDSRASRKVNFSGIDDGGLSQDPLLTLIMSERPPPKQHLVQHHSRRPYIHLHHAIINRLLSETSTSDIGKGSMAVR